MKSKWKVSLVAVMGLGVSLGTVMGLGVSLGTVHVLAGKATRYVVLDGTGKQAGSSLFHPGRF